MKAIQIKYLAPTNTKGARLKLIAEGSKPVTVSRDYELNADQQAKQLAAHFACDQWGAAVMGFGTLPTGDYCATISADPIDNRPDSITAVCP